jgi:hypothetical protein
MKQVVVLSLARLVNLKLSLKRRNEKKAFTKVQNCCCRREKGPPNTWPNQEEMTIGKRYLDKWGISLPPTKVSLHM